MKGYSFQKYNPETMAIAVGRSLPVSTKHCIEISGRIRRKSLDYAKKLLKDVIDMKRPIPMKRYTGGIGHKPGMAAGRYPVKACRHVLKLLGSCEANAQFKGLNTGNMVVIHACAHLGGKQQHYGRQRRRIMKRTYLEIVLEERAKHEDKDKKSRQRDTKGGKEETPKAGIPKEDIKTAQPQENKENKQSKAGVQKVDKAGRPSLAKPHRVKKPNPNPGGGNNQKEKDSETVQKVTDKKITDDNNQVAEETKDQG